MTDPKQRDLLEAQLEQTIRLVHKDGTRIELYLPAPADTVGETLNALGRLGFDFDRTPR